MKRAQGGGARGYLVVYRVPWMGGGLEGSTHDNTGLKTVAEDYSYYPILG